MAGPAAAFPIIDTHTHFYDPSRAQGVPWPRKEETILYQTTLPNRFLEQAKPHGVTGTVVVEASAWLEDNQWILDLAEREKSIVGFIGHLNPGEKDFGAHLDRFSKNKLFRGIRLGQGTLEQGVGRAAFVGDLRRMADQDLCIDVIGGPGLFAATLKVADAVPRLRMIVDHLPFETAADPGVQEASEAALRELTKRHQVYAKISNVIRRNAQGPITDPKHYTAGLEALWTLFGQERVIYGSNWPVSDKVGPYAALFRIVDDFVRAKGTQATEQYFWKNAKMAYKWISRA